MRNNIDAGPCATENIKGFELIELMKPIIEKEKNNFFKQIKDKGYFDDTFNYYWRNLSDIIGLIALYDFNEARNFLKLSLIKSLQSHIQKKMRIYL